MDESKQKEILDSLVDELQQIPPNMTTVKELMNTGVDLNVNYGDEEYESFLSAVLEYYHMGNLDYESKADNHWRPGNCLPNIIKFIIDSGFDVTRKNGIIGGCCLHFLQLIARDQYALEALEILLDAKADPSVLFTDGQSAVEYADFDSDFWRDGGEYYTSNLIVTMTEIMERYLAKEEYHGFKMADIFLGEKANKVYFEYDKELSKTDAKEIIEFEKEYSITAKRIVLVGDKYNLYIVPGRGIYAEQNTLLNHSTCLIELIPQIQIGKMKYLKETNQDGYRIEMGFEHCTFIISAYSNSKAHFYIKQSETEKI